MLSEKKNLTYLPIHIQGLKETVGLTESLTLFFFEKIRKNSIAPDKALFFFSQKGDIK